MKLEAVLSDSSQALHFYGVGIGECYTTWCLPKLGTGTKICQHATFDGAGCRVTTSCGICIGNSGSSTASVKDKLGGFLAEYSKFRSRVSTTSVTTTDEPFGRYKSNNIVLDQYTLVAFVLHLDRSSRRSYTAGAIGRQMSPSITTLSAIVARA